MKRIFVDFEMNAVDKKYKDERKQCHREIIEIGAVMLDEEWNEIASYKKYVKPEFNSTIYKRYEELTGISTGMVVGARTFGEALQAFVEWCGEDYTIYAWSDSDKTQIKKEAALKKFPQNDAYEYMLDNWVDFQAEFGEIVGAKEDISLENALNMCGITFKGRKHDALYDARNTGSLYVETRTSDVAAYVKQANRFITKETAGQTLGDMFNFATLRLQLI